MMALLVEMAKLRFYIMKDKHNLNNTNPKSLTIATYNQKS